MPRVLIVAGEASGDLHAAHIVRGVRERLPEAEFFGIGGKDMRAAGAEILVDSADLAVVGLWEVLAHRKTIFGALERMRVLLRKRRPDLVILTDYPDFNLRLARSAKAEGIPVLYYISPQVWAWREGRVKTIREVVDMMAVVFPFEADFYRRHGVPVRYVGHPLITEERPVDTPRAAIRAGFFGLSGDAPVLGLFPGSRQSEIRRLLPIILETAHRVREAVPDVRFLMPLASTLSESDLTPYLQDRPELDIPVIAGRTPEVIRACDAIVTVSGTVTLEIALAATPMVIINRLNWLTFQIVRRMVKLDHVGLCNIVAGERLVPERIQHEATADNITRDVLPMLTDPDTNRRYRDRLARVRTLLETPPENGDIVDLALEMLGVGGTTRETERNG